MTMLTMGPGDFRHVESIRLRRTTFTAPHRSLSWGLHSALPLTLKRCRTVPTYAARSSRKPAMNSRTLQRVIEAVPTSDGAGVKLRRSLGQSPYARLDPFLMLDHFSTDNADDYIAGFPAHPHRGFETVTYMLDGHMRHEDHLGTVGELKSGGVQWMTAGRGIIHSEMPQQDAGRMRGFQLWINLPAKDKMQPASYQDLEAGDIPEVKLGEKGKVRVIAGNYAGTAAPVKPGATDATYLDVHLPAS